MYSTDGYQALREATAFVRRGDRGVLGVSGPDRLVWLQGLLTNDVVALPPGEVGYTAYLTPQGRMISDMRVVQLADRTLLDVPAGLSDALRAKLDGLLFTEDAQVTDLSSSLSVIDVLGPQSADVVAVADVSNLAVAAAREVSFGLPGATLVVDVAAVADLVQVLTRAGAVETTLETLDVVRIEAGVPLFLVDMDEHTIPLEAGIEDRAISFTKGCYVGQEVIVRVMQRGQGRVAKKLVGLSLPKGTPAHPGEVILSGAREIGKVTSATWSPALEHHIALGYVHRDFVAPDTPVVIQTQTGLASARVNTLPFVGAVSPR
jgi:tRNA-modifying protein YgfZ